MAKNTITVTLLGDNKDLKKALGDSSTDVDGFGKKAGKALKIGTAAVAGLGAAAVAFGPSLVAAGSELDALGVKSETVFGSSLSEVTTWADGVAGSMGMTTAQLTGQAAAFGDLLKPMGFTADQAADMSTEMLDLSGALSAWSGGQVDASEAADVLAKAMLGEREGLKGLGISISEADVSARLAAKGQEELTGAALEQAKALATQELILEKSTDAQTAWADGSMDGVKAQNEASASIEQLKENFVRGIYPALQQILPVVQRVASWIGERIPTAFAFAERIGNRLRDVFQFLGDNMNYVVPILSGLAVAAATLLVPAFLAWAASAGAAAVATLAAAAPFIAIGAAIAAVAAGLVWAYQNVDWFREAVDKVVDVLSAGFSIALSVAKVGVDLLWSAIQTAAGWIQTAWDKSEALRSLLAAGFRAALIQVKNQFNFLKSAVEKAASWIQTAWDKSDKLRSLFAGTFKTAVNGIKTAFNSARTAVDRVVSAIQSVIDKANRAISLVSRIPLIGGGSGPTGGIASSALQEKHDGGWVGSPMGAPKDIPIMAQQGEYVLSRADVAAIGSGSSGRPLVINLMDRHTVNAVVSQRDADLLMSLEAGVR